jgi:dihydroflavonol-4-reductase
MTGLDLVTGGCGFLGRHVVAALLDRGRRVRVLDVADPGDLAGEVEVVTGSVTDSSRVAAAMPAPSACFTWPRFPNSGRASRMCSSA